MMLSAIVNEQAFGFKEEAEIVEKLRNRAAMTLSPVAVQIVGHIAFCPEVIESGSSDFEVITLAPMSVIPEYQRRGSGSQLVRAGLQECRKIGLEIIVVPGHPTYYPRFGFIPAMKKGITCEFEAPEEAFMVLELREGSLAGRGGLVKFQPEFRDAL